MALVRIFGKTLDLSSAAIQYYRNNAIPFEIIDARQSPRLIQEAEAFAAAAKGFGQTASSALGNIIKTGRGAAGGAAAGGATGGLLQQGGKTLSAFPQGAGFGLGYGVGVRAGYELGFPTLFGEKGSGKRQTIIKSGLGLDPSKWLDALRGVSGGLDLGAAVGNARAGRDGGIATDFRGTPVEAGLNPKEGLGFTDEITLSGTATLPESNEREIAVKNVARYTNLVKHPKVVYPGISRTTKANYIRYNKRMRSLLADWKKKLQNIDTLAKNR